MHFEIEDLARGWVKIGHSFEPAALPWVVRGCDLLIQHAGAVPRIREADRVLMYVERGQWVKPPNSGVWRSSGWCDLPGFADTLQARR